MLTVGYVIFAAILALWAYLIRRTFVLATATSSTSYDTTTKEASMQQVRLEVNGHVATLYRGDEPIGEWQAGRREYEAAGVEWPGCSCGEEHCRHGLAYYWGETLSAAELDAMIALRAGRASR